MPLVLFVLLGLTVIFAFSGGYVFFLACLRRKEPDWLVEEQVKKTPYGKYYRYILETEQWLKMKKTEDVFITSQDGLRLHALWIPAENPRGTILLAHGYRSTWRVDFGLVLSLYHDLGFNLLVPDQRSHGLSEGRFITFGVKESRDMLGWIDFHNREKGEYPMMLSGLSMGASTVLYLADEKLPGNVKGIIADCGFSSPWEIIKSVYSRVIRLPAAPSLFFADLFSRLFAGFSLREKDTRRSLRHSRLPVMLVHGSEDGFVPPQMSQQGYDACTGNKRLLMIEGADHGISFLVDTERYLNAVKAFQDEIFQ